MNKNEVHGKIQNVKGRMKQAAGVAVGNPSLEKEGAVERTAGTVEAELGKARRKVGDALTRLGNAVRK
jgi:uncharacterized protein YjbJ (UPF0337 family)